MPKTNSVSQTDQLDKATSRATDPDRGSKTWWILTSIEFHKCPASTLARNFPKTWSTTWTWVDRINNSYINWETAVAISESVFLAAAAWSIHTSKSIRATSASMNDSGDTSKLWDPVYNILTHSLIESMSWTWKPISSICKGKKHWLKITSKLLSTQPFIIMWK